MKRSPVLIVVGLLLVAMGLVWMLQGLGVIGGSAMSGQTLWAVVGPIVAVAGLALVYRGARRPKT
jgi:hypothetical protein